jgi:hypothetical protein
VIDPATEPTLAAAVTARFDVKYGWSDGLIVEIVPVDASTKDATNATDESTR